MGAYDHLNGNHLLRDSCSWAAYTGISENATTLERTATYATAATLACNMAQPGREWRDRWPDADFTNAITLWLPRDSTVAPKDKITYDSAVYRVKAVQDWQGACFIALCERIEGVTA
jgi:hypothetical protein